MTPNESTALFALLSGDAFGPRPHASHRAAARLGLSVSVAIA